jgi:hypothetical protein
VTTLPVRDLRPELQKPLAEERFGDRRGFSDVLTCRAVLDDVREDASSGSSRSLSTILKGKVRDEIAIPRKAGDASHAHKPSEADAAYRSSESPEIGVPPPCTR